MHFLFKEIELTYQVHMYLLDSFNFIDSLPEADRLKLGNDCLFDFGPSSTLGAFHNNFGTMATSPSVG